MDLPAYEEPYPDRKRGKKLWWILLLAIGIPVGLILLVATLGLLFYATATDLEVQEADRAVVPTAAYLADWFAGLDASLGVETWTKKRFLDGSIEVDYEHDRTDVGEDESAVWISCTVTVDKKASDARITYEAGNAGTWIGLGVTGVTREEREDLFSWGERSRCAVLRGREGQPVGNHFTCLDGLKTFDWTVVGLYFDEPGALAEVLEPVLRRLATYEP